MIQIKSEQINDYQITVILPTDYNTESTYRTIYMHDGGNAAKQALNYIDHLIISGQLEPVIIIGIVPINRDNDYTPWPASSLLSNKSETGGQVKEYLDVLVHEIKPIIDANYATNPSPDHTAIAGCSFGGLASIFASYYHPEIFHDYIILSASFWYKDVMSYIEGEEIIHQEANYTKPMVHRDKHRMYLYVGELEGIYRDSAQKHMLEYTKKAYAALEKEGFTDFNLLFETHPEGTHDVCFFSPHFIRAIRWLYGKKRSNDTYFTTLYL